MKALKKVEDQSSRITSARQILATARANLIGHVCREDMMGIATSETRDRARTLLKLVGLDGLAASCSGCSARRRSRTRSCAKRSSATPAITAARVSSWRARIIRGESIGRTRESIGAGGRSTARPNARRNTRPFVSVGRAIRAMRAYWNWQFAARHQVPFVCRPSEPASAWSYAQYAKSNTDRALRRDAFDTAQAWRDLALQRLALQKGRS